LQNRLDYQEEKFLLLKDLSNTVDKLILLILSHSSSRILGLNEM